MWKHPETKTNFIRRDFACEWVFLFCRRSRAWREWRNGLRSPSRLHPSENKMAVRPPKLTRWQILPGTQAKKTNNVLRSNFVWYWPKLPQSGPKIIRLKWKVRNFIVQSEPNLTRLKCVTRFIYLFAVLVPQRGARDSKQHLFKTTSYILLIEWAER